MKHVMLRKLLLVFSALSLLVAPTVPVFAATAKTQSQNATTNNTNTLKLSPLRTDLTIQAGGTAKVVTYLTNLTANPIEIHPIENDFVAGDEKGTPALILDENSYAPTHSLKRFMVPLSNVTIPANDTKEIDVNIVVPKSAQPGGYFGAIRYAPASAGGNQTVNLSASVASLILLTVPGPATEQLNLTNFDVQQDGGTGSNFRSPNDLSLLIRFENKGSVQESPYGQISVAKGSTQLYSYGFNLNTPRQTILPDSARRWSIPIQNLGKFGKYTITGTFSYGSKGQSMQVSKTIWIIPTTYIIGGILALLIVVGLIVGVWAFLRSYKQRILRQNRRR